MRDTNAGLSRIENEAISDASSEIVSEKSLPLFRPEAISTQERFFGEVLLIRPFPWMFWAWLAIATLVIALAGFGLVTYSRSSQPNAAVHAQGELR